MSKPHGERPLQSPDSDFLTPSHQGIRPGWPAGMRVASYLGFDPGGNGAFGIALLRGTEMLVGTVSTIDEAIDWARNYCDEPPYAAGIDSLLHWSTGNGRAVDWLLRRNPAYKPTRLSVVSQNSLYGSMVIGGMGLALRLRALWHDPSGPADPGAAATTLARESRGFRRDTGC